jgi:tRNA(His) 5'-end guanylyltransferase
VSDFSIAYAESKTFVFDYKNLVQFVDDVVNNHSSMLQDFIHQRYLTHINHLNQAGINILADEFIYNEMVNRTNPLHS